MKETSAITKTEVTKMSEEELILQTANAVAYIDLLGTTEATSNESASEQISHGNKLRTIWGFLADICKIEPQIEVSGISDSLVIFRQDFTKLLPLVVALFQISCLTRGFRIRAGIEIGNVYGSGSHLGKKLTEGTIKNMIVPQYLYGDAITGAVLAEKKLKGSRLVLGATITKMIENMAFEKLRPLLIKREDGVIEVKWTETEYTRDIFTALNKLDCYTKPEDTIEYGFKQYLRYPNDDYSKMMVGLGVEWGILKVDSESVAQG